VITPPPPRLGIVRSALQVERGALGVLKQSLGAYLDAVGAQDGLAVPLVGPRSYACVAQLDHFAEEQLPAVIITSPGTLAEPKRRGDGVYEAQYGLAVAAFISTATREATHELVRVWCEAIRACLVQQPSLGGVCDDLTLLAEDYHEQPVIDRRSLAAGIVSFAALVAGIVDAYAGPLPPNDPFGRVATIDFEIEKIKEMPHA
jgi:hypothetical protein